MKKWFLMAACLMANVSWAGPVDVETARAIATEFLNGHSAKARSGKAANSQQMKLTKTMRSAASQQALFYVFNNEGEDGGYVVAAADEAAHPVLAYSEDGTFDWEQMSCCQRLIMESYAREIETALNQPERTAAAIKARKAAEADEATGPRKAYQKVSPLVKSKWDQGTPYNTLCPIDPDTKKRCITGCVATAAAQLMYYYKYPDQGQDSYSYEWRGQTLTANFGSTTYQWDKMKNVYKNSPSDPDNAVATLIYHCGVAANMNYGSSLSYGYIGAYQFVNYFRYSPRAKDIQLSDCGATEFERLMHKELEAGRPIIFRGADSNDEGGHLFICDGCSTGNYFHFNLGWSGEKDGYYKLSALDTEWYELSFFQSMTYGLMPPGGSLMDTSGNEYELIGDGEVAINKMKATGKFTLPTSVTIEGTTYAVTGVNAYALADNAQLTELTIPAGMMTLNTTAIINCRNLQKVVIEDSETPLIMGEDVFDGSPITTVYQGRDISTSWSSFYYLPISSLTLGEQVTRLSRGAYAGSYFESITLPAKLESIGEAALENTHNLKTINIAAGNTHFAMKGISLINTDSQTLIRTLVTADDSYTVPNGVESIARGAMWPIYVQEIHLPGSVTYLGSNFMYNPNLQKVYLDSKTPATCSEWAWYGLQNQSEGYDFTVYVPRGSLSTYKRTKVWSTLPLSEWDIPSDVERVEAENNTEVTYYGVDGTRLSAPKTGINILRSSDRKAKKAFFK